MTIDTAKIDKVINTAIAEKRIVGTVVEVSVDRETVYHRAAGLSNREDNVSMERKQLFRLASMTKAVVSVATLAFADRGLLRLDDPVTLFIPEFTPRLASGEQPQITLRHLLTHTAGLSYGFLEPFGGPYRAAGVSDGLDATGVSLSENVARIAKAPLLYAPGTDWSYSVAMDVLGLVLERVSGRDLRTIVHEYITAPLGMVDTGFDPQDPRRLATPYADGVEQPQRMTEPFRLPFGPSEILYSPARALDRSAFPSGGVGLIGTASDYIRFLEAVRTGGAGVIAPETAAAFVTNATGELPITASGPGFGWGLGVAVLLDPTLASSPANRGTWSWGGVYGNSFWVDPVAKISAVALTNTAVAGMAGAFPTELRRSVYG